MAMRWLVSFKSISWRKVLSAAPSIADGARRYWSSVTEKGSLFPKRPVPAEEQVYSPDPSISAIEKQMQALELRTAQLGEEIILSSGLIDKLAEQQSQLVQAVDILRVRTRALLWVCGLLAIAVIVMIYLVVDR